MISCTSLAVAAPVERARAPERPHARLLRAPAYVRRGRATLTPGEIDFIQTLFAPRRLDKGEALQRAGEPARDLVFVARGCLRSYVIAQGQGPHRELRTRGLVARRLRQVPERRAFHAVHRRDRSLGPAADRLPSHQRILDSVPGYAAAYQVGLQRLRGGKGQADHHPAERVCPRSLPGLRHAYPTLLRRVPLGMLASYLGMSPETLSRIRRSSRPERPPGIADHGYRSRGSASTLIS